MFFKRSALMRSPSDLSRRGEGALRPGDLSRGFSQVVVKLNFAFSLRLAAGFVIFRF